ncbi:hypothetical protein GCM10010169_25410 [Micromonospora fulviviridis]|uniref:hypothetical protein n=1 Tax=Micromonospora fulviviridis TaxID=47860 RepID=UPI00166F2AB3|nr:hypothetical protein [Micromonospora fulviviridis]GGR80161.1 hypothetical protein GCM10010169_25410 [Micromonospora fulviviridis]
MNGEDRKSTLAALDVLDAVLDGDGQRVVQLVDQHGDQAVILGLSRVVVGIGQQHSGSLDAFRAFLRGWAVDLQLADLTPAGD